MVALDIETLVEFEKLVEVLTFQPTVFSKITLVRLLQLRNAEEPMEVTLDGIVMLVRLLQPEKA